MTFKRKLSLEEQNLFIQRVISGCFDIFGEYHPEGFTPMFNATVLQLCSNTPALSKPAAKKEDGEKGEALLDIDAMNDFYNTIKDDVMKAGGKEYETFVSKLDVLCYQRLAWINEQRKYRHLETIAKMCDDMQALIQVAGTFINNLEDIVESTDTEELLQYAKSITQNTESLDGENLAENMFKVYEGAKASQALDDDA